MKILIIVESPNKIKTIEKILEKIDKSNEYTILASFGHIIDLDSSKLSYNENYEVEYQICEGKDKVVKHIRAEYNKCDYIILATDKDREGEMIAWSIEYILGIQNSKRIVFTAITEEEIGNAIKNPLIVNQNLVNAQKARRLIDRIIGYKISPIVQRCISGNRLSAGRVQSVIVKLIIERENEIQKFIKEELKSKFTITGILDNNKAVLYYKNNIYESNDAPNELLLNLNKSEYTIKDIQNKERIQNPPEPYTTSTLQQEGYNKLGWSSKKTMMIAQHLYEKGYITYMRTDSTKLSADAILKIHKYITDTYTFNLINKQIKRKKEKNIQGAHEAIRPVYMSIPNIEGDELRLYLMIFKRAIGSQMIPAVFNINIISISCNQKDYEFIVKTETIKELGYLILYREEQQTNINVNKYKINDIIQIKDLESCEKYNTLPYRYNDASLINKLDPKNLNIGRPSTYATFIEKIQEKQYVEKKDIKGISKEIKRIYIEANNIKEEIKEINIGDEINKFVPTILGTKIVEMLNNNFREIMAYEFTAGVEKNLDEIEEGITKYKEVLINFDNIINEQIKNVKYNKTEDIIKEYEDIKLCRAMKGLIIKQNKKVIMVPERFDENITLDEIKELLKYPKEIGKINRKKVVIHEGKYGFYVKYDGNNYKLEINPEIVTLDDFNNILEKEKEKILWKQEEGDLLYTIQNGKYGLYISVKNKKNKKKPYQKKLPDKNTIETITLEEVKMILQRKTKRYKKKN